MLDLNIIPEKINQIFVKLESIISDIKCLNEAGDLPCLMGKLNLIFLISRGTKNSNQCVKEKKIIERSCKCFIYHTSVED